MRADLYERASEAADWLRAQGVQGADVAVILGSGLGDFADRLEERRAVPYGAIPHWPEPSVAGHPGRFAWGLVRGRRVLALAGRVHFYEGQPLSAVTFAVRVLGRLGVPRLIVTNAAGGVNTRFARGALMIIDDHLNLMGTNPLIGPNDDRFGVRFPDMSAVYSPRLRALADEAARAAGVAIEHGVYAAVHGPSYETPAEIRALRAIGADAVGMSTVPEAIVARHMGIEVLGLSCITNMAAGVLPQPLVHDEVMATAREVRDRVVALLEEIVGRL